MLADFVACPPIVLLLDLIDDLEVLLFDLLLHSNIPIMYEYAITGSMTCRSLFPTRF